MLRFGWDLTALEEENKLRIKKRIGNYRKLKDDIEDLIILGVKIKKMSEKDKG